jgi:zinc protease
MKNKNSKMKNLIVVLSLIAFALPIFGQKSEKPMNSKTTNVYLPGSSPIISMRIQFLTGSVDDPKGKEGLASLTAAMIAQAGSKRLTYDQIVARFYPMAAGFGWQVDKEMTTFYGQTHRDNLDKYYELISQMMFEPGFREEDFKRLKDEAINFLKVNLREGNDEELGKERLYNIIYSGHPYGHHSVGTISGLESITLDDVRNFYKQNYTRANLVLGLSGGFDEKFSKRLEKDFARLPKGKKQTRDFPAPKLDEGMKIDIVQRETRAVAISLGFPIEVNRSHPDYPALALVASYFGQHRSSNSYLYGRLRELRGLNYGDYAYIEYFPRGMYQFEPDPNLARRQQIFQIWIRPVEPVNANFTLRAALYEYDKLVKNGLTKEIFEDTRQFLTKYVNILTQTKDAELGYALDSLFYGTPEFNQFMKDSLAKLTLEDVNRAIKKHLSTDRMRIVMVAKDAEDLKRQIVENEPGKIVYASPKPNEVLEEDKIISVFPIPVKAEDVTITPIERVFQ